MCLSGALDLKKMNGKTRSYSSSPLYEQPPKKKINSLEKDNRDYFKNNLCSTVTSNEDDVFLPDDNASLQNAQHTTANIFADLTHSISLDKDGNDTRGKYSGISTPSLQLSPEFTESHSHSTGDIEFSDSIANQQKLSNWHCDHCSGTPWQNDTSPSDNLDVDESILGSNSCDHSPSDASFSSHNYNQLSPFDNDIPDAKQNADERDYVYSNSNQNTVVPIDDLINDLNRQHSGDNVKDPVTSANATG